MKEAIVLLSGGLDSTVILAIALSQGYSCRALSFNYGQKHAIELMRAKKIANHYDIPLHTINIDKNGFGPAKKDYVPARNTIFLSYATGLAETYNAEAIYIGVNNTDYTNFPDCRPDYISAYQNLINLSTWQAIDGLAPKLETPLIQKTKQETIQLGINLKAPLELTWTCYTPSNGKPCGQCDACKIRQKGFDEAGITDPAMSA